MSLHNTVRIATVILAVSLAGCGGGESLGVASKKECIPEVARRLAACSNDAECERGITRFAGYCYNTAAGDQLDICRGGQYFFEQPLAELKQNDPTLFGQLDERRQEILLLTGESYCRYNTN